MEHPDRGSMSWLVEDKENRSKDEEGRPLSWLVDFPKQHYSCGEDEHTLREIICQLNTNVNPELFCEKSAIFRAASFNASKNISTSTTRNDSTQEEQRTHFPDVNTWLCRGSLNSWVTNQWEEEERLEKNREDLEEEENLEEIWEKSNQWEKEKLEKRREEMEEEEEDNLEKSKEELEAQGEHREQSERSVIKGQLVGRTKYNSISEVPDHMDLDLEVGGGRSVENR